jgi:hypothetical protein
MCKVGIVVLSVGNECEGGRGSLLTGWGRIEGEGEGKGREWVRRGRMICWKGAMDFSTREGGGVKGVRVGMRRW